MTSADDFLRISESVNDIRQYSLLTDSIFRTIQRSTEPVRSHFSARPKAFTANAQSPVLTVHLSLRNLLMQERL